MATPHPVALKFILPFVPTVNTPVVVVKLVCTLAVCGFKSILDKFNVPSASESLVATLMLALLPFETVIASFTASGDWLFANTVMVTLLLLAVVVERQLALLVSTQVIILLFCSVVVV